MTAKKERLSGRREGWQWTGRSHDFEQMLHCMCTFVACKYGSVQTVESKLAFQVCHHKIRQGKKNKTHTHNKNSDLCSRGDAASAPQVCRFCWRLHTLASHAVESHGAGVTGWSLHCSLSRVTRTWHCKEPLNQRVCRSLSPLGLTSAGAAGSISVTAECVSHFTPVKHSVDLQHLPKAAWHNHTFQAVFKALNALFLPRCHADYSNNRGWKCEGLVVVMLMMCGHTPCKHHINVASCGETY